MRLGRSRAPVPGPCCTRSRSWRWRTSGRSCPPRPMSTCGSAAMGAGCLVYRPSRAEPAHQAASWRGDRARDSRQVSVRPCVRARLAPLCGVRRQLRGELTRRSSFLCSDWWRTIRSCLTMYLAHRRNAAASSERTVPRHGITVSSLRPDFLGGHTHARSATGCGASTAWIWRSTRLRWSVHVFRDPPGGGTPVLLVPLSTLILRRDEHVSRTRAARAA